MCKPLTLSGTKLALSIVRSISILYLKKIDLFGYHPLHTTLFDSKWTRSEPSKDALALDGRESKSATARGASQLILSKLVRYQGTRQVMLLRYPMTFLVFFSSEIHMFFIIVEALWRLSASPAVGFSSESRDVLGQFH